MPKKLVMGNEAIALGAINAGVRVVTGYPGTPSTEVLESVTKHNDGSIYVEWSVNEKSAIEVAAGASYAGARTMVTMKQVGLNVASDAVMSLSYVGVAGGMVILVADDPGPISSQTEQDTRTFGAFSKLPVFDPSSPEEAFLMMTDAFALSEEFRTPVIMRPTTRICHAYASMDVPEMKASPQPSGFEKSPDWVIFPRLSYRAHLRIEERNRMLEDCLSDYRFNTLSGSGTRLIAAGGVSYAYVCEALEQLGASCAVLKIGVPHPFPTTLALRALQGAQEVLVCEELDGVIERALLQVAGEHHLPVTIRGKRSGDMPCAGENTVDDLAARLRKFLGLPEGDAAAPVAMPPLPVRPPVLCAGCPHRASFYAVKQAMRGKKAVFAGDIGCYTLGNAQPLDMVDTCLCMGAGLTIAQGIGRAEPDTVCFAFIGDSTFFHTGLAGITNAVYNGARMVAVILDNSTTAMTGQQPNPSTGWNAMGEVAQKIDIEGVLRALGVAHVYTADPLNHAAAVNAAKAAAENDGVSAVIYRSPCIAVTKPKAPLAVDRARCTGCMRCVRELGCPAIVKEDGKVSIDVRLCTGCTLCQGVCPVGAIGGGKDE